MELEIVPHVGIGPVRFGMSREDVREAMDRIGVGQPDRTGRSTDTYFGSGFYVHFGDEGLVNFIELGSSLDEEVVFDGLDVFDTPADELLAAAERQDTADPTLSRPPTSYTFPGIILTLWGRDKQYDHRGGQTRPMFGAVGLGSPHYLEAVRAIHARK